MDDISHRVRALGRRFSDRIEPWRLDFALEYIDFNELPLAFETLYTYIYEYAEKISSTEYSELNEISQLLNTPLSPITQSALTDMICDRG
ncbi:MafI family immunity protein [Sphingomonas sp. 22176]|uniref:MafI family immunity protein n=1 Tax=Sphingomonas sp. 22176 TaxID=3453884 RepID=UPI003F84D34E